MEKMLYSTTEACQALNIGKTKLFELLRSGQLESVQIGASRLIPADACAALVDHLRAERPEVAALLELIDDQGLVDVAAIPKGTSLTDLERAKRIIAERRTAVDAA